MDILGSINGDRIGKSNAFDLYFYLEFLQSNVEDNVSQPFSVLKVFINPHG